MKTNRFSFLQPMANSIKTRGLYLSLFFLFTLSLVQGQNVGIGINNPQVPLHVYKTGTNEVLRLQTNDPNGSGFLSIYNANEGKGFLGLFGHPDNVKFGTYFGSTGKLQFVTNGNDIRMSILSDGNMGIGTETPTELLDLAGNLNLSGQIKANGVAGLAGQVLQSDGSGSMSWVNMGGGVSSDFLVDADGDTRIQVEENPDEDIIRFDVGGNERVTIGEGNNMLSSTTDLSGARAVEGIASLYDNSSTKNYGGYFQANGDFGRGVYAKSIGDFSRAVEGIASSTSAGTKYGGYFSAAGQNAIGVYGQSSDGYGVHGRAGGTQGRGIYGRASGTSGSGVYGEAVGTTAYGVRGIATNNSQSVKYGGYFSAAGNLGRGVLGSTGGENGWGVYGVSYGLNGYGVRGFGSGPSYTGVYGQGSNFAGYFNGNLHYTGTLTGPSDIRFKKNIIRNQTYLDKLVLLNPVSYEFDNDKYEGMNFSKGVRHGFIAQELELVYPELVSNKKHQINDVDPDSGEVPIYEEFKSVNYLDLIPDLVGAIQEQQELIELLKTENEAMKTANEEMRTANNEMKNANEEMKNELLLSGEKQNTIEARLVKLERAN